MQAERKNFVYGNKELGICGCISNGISEEVANGIYDQMISFASYAFNKSHAACYAAIAMQTAYLKAHYPCEFFAGLLTSVMDNPDLLPNYLTDCKQHGIQILPPDINSSQIVFSPSGENALYYGLNSIKKVGLNNIQLILEERKNGNFKSLYDFMFRCSYANKGMLESLINAGAFDFTKLNRPTLISNIPAIQKDIKKKKKKLEKKKNANVVELQLFDTTPTANESEKAFDENFELKKLPDYDPIEKVMKEKEVTGSFISYHPVDMIQPPSKAVSINKIYENLKGYAFNKKPIITYGLVTNLKTFFTKKSGQKMATFNLNSGDAEIDEIKVVIFPREYSNLSLTFKENGLISIQGNVQINESGEASIIASEIETLDYRKVICVYFSDIHSKSDASQLVPEMQTRLMNLFVSTETGTPVIIYYRDDNNTLNSYNTRIKVSDIPKTVSILRTVWPSIQTDVHAVSGIKKGN